MSMTIATWNVNSVRARLPNILEWLGKNSADIVLMQEIKTLPENFPTTEFEDLGYNVQIKGQKSYHGVAILSRHRIEDVVDILPGDEMDDQARYLEAWINGLRIVCLYAPNVNPVRDENGQPHEKFRYKLAWQQRLKNRIEELLLLEEPLVIGGDFNIIPEEIDCRNVKSWLDDALFQPESRAFYRSLQNLGLVDAFRARTPDPHQYTFWDYQGGAWQRDHGIRIDHFLLSAQACDRLERCWIDKAPRDMAKASDHTPVLVTVTTG